MQKEKTVSVIMPAYNEEKYIGEAIESIVAQTYPNWELIIVDDCSQDKTTEIVKQYMESDKRIQLYSFSQNQGACRALNKALEMITGQYVCWLSADDKYKKDMMASSIYYLETHPEMQAVFCKCEFIDEFSQWVRDYNFDDSYLNIGESECKQPYWTMCYIGNAFCACSLLATAEAFRKAGYFDIDHPYAGDYDYMMRMAAYSNIGFLNQVNMESRIHSEQVTCLGKNDIDAIHAYCDMLFNDDVRKRLFAKAGIRHTRDDIIATFQSRKVIYAKGEKETCEIEKSLETFIKCFPLCIKADEYCLMMRKALELQKWDEIVEYIQEMPEDIRDFINKEDYSIIMAAYLEHQGLYENAEQVLQSVLERNANNYEAHYIWGKLYEKQNYKYLALERYTTAVICSQNTDMHNKMICNLKRFVSANM